MAWSSASLLRGHHRGDTPLEVAPSRPHRPARCRYDAEALGASSEGDVIDAGHVQSSLHLGRAQQEREARFLKSCITRTASFAVRDHQHKSSVCFPHSDLRSGSMAAASAAAAEGTNTIVRGGGATSPAAARSSRICRASATSLARARGH